MRSAPATAPSLWPTAAGRPARRRAATQAGRTATRAPRFADDLELVRPDVFAHALRHERHRAERTGAALSVLVFRPTPDGAAGDLPGDRAAGAPARLADIVRGTKRTTDILGWVGGDTLVVLCPDTGAGGCRNLLGRITRLAGGGPCDGVVATYPHDLFDTLAEGRSATPALQLVMQGDERGGSAEAYALKRALDIVGASLSLCLLAPLMLLVACAVALSSPGPVIFRQTRLGRAGRPFTFYKFRSMRVDADDGVHRAFVAALIRHGGGAASASAGAPAGAAAPAQAPYKLAADPRVTPLGRWMRRTSVDELPQLLNVLKGEMSLVGPRPALAYETALYQPWHLARLLSVRPGLTGLWQVEGRSRVSFDEMVRMDLRYIRDCTLRLDLSILLRTPLVVVRGRGAV
ncbi:MAG: hypothetical protein RLZZ584_2204 [Pseudomonadota bacterium]|jgi:lipopolysaccharide/colanic/teichoic acid biosynthesis glycosyltransferase